MTPAGAGPGAGPPAPADGPDATARLKTVEKLAITVLMGLATAAWRGFVISTLWGWFLADPFHVPEIRTLHAMALVMLADVLFQSKADTTMQDMVTPQRKKKHALEKDEAEAAMVVLKMFKDSFAGMLVKMVLESFGPPATTLAVGAILKVMTRH